MQTHPLGKAVMALIQIGLTKVIASGFWLV
ncbi:hypothetical protein LEJE111609_15320 [Lelliottia jeotgali]|jgi:energy-converting hydrogenase Eha subunit C